MAEKSEQVPEGQKAKWVQAADIQALSQALREVSYEPDTKLASQYPDPTTVDVIGAMGATGAENGVELKTGNSLVP